MLKNKFLTFILFLAITFSASAIGGFATFTYKEPWYSLLNKPVFNPPDWIFGPVWTSLYIMMTVSIWLYWHTKNKDMNTIYIYFIHLIFNTTWSVVFFVFHNIELALLNLIVIIIFIAILTFKYKKINNLSFYLMIPYLLWSSYALILNFTLVLLN